METLRLIAGLVFLAGFFPYIRSILWGSTRPPRSSWFIWATLDWVTAVGMYQKDALTPQMIAATSGATLIALLTLKKGRPGWEWYDTCCLVCVGAGLAALRLLHNPAMGIAVSLVGMLIGVVPTVLSVWHDPHRESRIAWTIGFIACVMIVIAIPHWTVADAAQPIVFLVMQTAVVAVLYGRPRRFISTEGV